MRQRQQSSPILLPILLVAVGIVILLNNYLIIDADIIGFWPILLILLGVMVLWRGDLAPSWEARSFGITRGTVESGSLEITSAEIDVDLKALQRAGRLIAGQYTARSRPRLTVRKEHAWLQMQRGDTWLFSLADWEVEMARDLPWSLLMSAHLGQITADLRGLVIHQAHIATGFGNIKVITPAQEAGPIYIRSTFGDIQVIIPGSVPAVVRVKASPFCNVTTRGVPFNVDQQTKIYTTPAYRPDLAALDITVAGTFGNIQLAAGS